MTTISALPRRRHLPSNNKLKIGLFGANCSSGRAITTVPDRWSGSWSDCLELARMADDAAIDFMLPIGRWKGYGGETDYQGATLETVTWAAGLLASTNNIVVFGTVHAPLIHPIIAAKEFVTADHIGKGRFGLNVVCGWNTDEFNMFGVMQREHEQRYAYAQEWIDAVFRAWGAEENFDVDGQFIKLKAVRAKPKPFGGMRPVVMNAGVSPAGRTFAVRNCDAFFTGIERDNVGRIASVVKDAKAEAARFGREIDVYSVGTVCCRPTRREAEEYYHYVTQEKADWPAIEGMLALQGIQRDNTPPERFEHARKSTPNWMAQTLLIGTPDDVAGWLANISEAGVTGVGLSLIHYLDEFPYFRDEVLPRLERAGLRGAKRALEHNN